MKETFYDRILFLLKIRKTSLVTFYQETKIPKSTMKYWKNGNLPNADTVLVLSDYFKVSTDWLLKGTEEYKIQESKVTNMDLIIFLDKLDKLSSEIRKCLI